MPPSGSDDPSGAPLDARPRRRRGVTLRRRADGSADVVGPGDAPLGRVNVTAAAAFELCDGDTTVEEMATAVRDVFAVDRDRAVADLVAALDALAAIGALESPL